MEAPEAASVGAQQLARFLLQWLFNARTDPNAHLRLLGPVDTQPEAIVLIHQLRRPELLEQSPVWYRIDLEPEPLVYVPEDWKQFKRGEYGPRLDIMEYVGVPLRRTTLWIGQLLEAGWTVDISAQSPGFDALRDAMERRYVALARLFFALRMTPAEAPIYGNQGPFEELPLFDPPETASEAADVWQAVRVFRTSLLRLLLLLESDAEFARAWEAQSLH